MTHLTYLEAAVVGLIQGVSELFPVSSLGHNVLLPALIGGSWATDLNVARPESPYLAFIVGLHVATALALLVYFWRDWVRILGGFIGSIRYRQVRTRDQKLAWMIILATIPVGLAAEHAFRVVFGKPSYAAVFLMVNGVILYCGEKFRPRASVRADAVVTHEWELAQAAVRTATQRSSGDLAGCPEAVELAEPSASAPLTKAAAGTLSAWACRHSSGAALRRSASRRSRTRPYCWWWTGPTTNGRCWPGWCWPG